MSSLWLDSELQLCARAAILGLSEFTCLPEFCSHGLSMSAGLTRPSSLFTVVCSHRSHPSRFKKMIDKWRFCEGENIEKSVGVAEWHSEQASDLGVEPTRIQLAEIGGLK